jgi:conjugative relaxase-like TrwC/TraI family protein
MIQSVNSAHAKSYFHDALSRGDYYMEDAQELGGIFHGKAASMLSLNGQIEQSDFYRLCENTNPKTGDQLTPRTIENRTVGYDINFHCPKSISIVNALSDDSRVLQAFRDSVNKTMNAIQDDAKTRVRKMGKMEDRNTSNLIWAEFIHQTARPVDNSPPDPHLHAHCFVLNSTYDEVENQFKAGQFRDIKRDMPYYQAMFHKELATSLSELGYGIRCTEKSFELDIVPQEAIDIFSKRTDAIGNYAIDNGITAQSELDQLGARTRAKKEKGYSMSQLRSLWRDQVSHIKEKTDKGDNGRDIKLTVKDCISHAISHCFERHSVMNKRTLLSHAISHAKATPHIKISDIHKAFDQDDSIIKFKQGDIVHCTTYTVHRHEQRMLALARFGRGQFKPLNRNTDDLKLDNLNSQQSNAVKQILSSIDQVNIIKGGAGTGKTTLMTQGVEQIEKAGKKVFTFAPSSQASKDVLRNEGFENADTVARLLIDSKLQEQIENQVLWIDEASLLSTKDMTTLLQLANDKNARVILSGDTRQHNSVERGDALRLLKQMGGVKVAGVNRIYRQKVESYRKAVEDISQGDAVNGFNRLDKMGSIVEKNPYALLDDLSNDYMSCFDQKKSALIIAPTHEQGRRVTQKIRDELKTRKALKGNDRTYECLKPKNWTTAQRQEHSNYKTGDVIQFHQNVKGVKRGSKMNVSRIKDNIIWLKNGMSSSEIPLNLGQVDKYSVYEKTPIDIAKGDTIRITKNAQDQQKKRLNNGDMLKVIGFDRKGNIKAQSAKNDNGKTIILDKDFGNFNHGYVMTSHAAQGKTVDKVFIAQPSATFGAVNKKQFYVSVSRGREDVKIYTDSREEMLDHIQLVGDRMSAVEMMNQKRRNIEHQIGRSNAEKTYKPSNNKHKDHDKEPKL